MAFLANYPIAMAPGLGLNAYFSFIICGKMGVPWQTALGIVFLSDAIPAFLTLLVMPLTFSISNGLAIGFISYPLIKGLSGRAGEVHWLVYVLAGLFLLRYIFI